MKKLVYKSLSIIPLVVGAAAMVHAASAGGSKRAPMSADALPPPIVSTTVPQMQFPVSLETDLAGSASASAEAAAVNGSATLGTSTISATATVPPALSSDSLVALGATGSLGGPTVIQEIRVDTPDNRARLFSDLDLRLQANSHALTTLRARSAELSSEDSARLAAAEADLRAKEAALKASLGSARSASAESWNSARLTLASDYDAYIAAVKSYESMYPTAATAVAISADKNEAVGTATIDTAKAEPVSVVEEESPAHVGAGPDRNESPANRSAAEAEATPAPQAGPNRVSSEMQ